MNKHSVTMVRCDICGEEFDKAVMYEIFTGRTKYICSRCYRKGNEELNAKHEAWRDSAKGKQAIEYFKKNK